jgi:hypothetical protein
MRSHAEVRKILIAMNFSLPSREPHEFLFALVDFNGRADVRSPIPDPMEVHLRQYLQW